MYIHHKKIIRILIKLIKILVQFHEFFKGVVHFKKNLLLTPMSSKMSMSFFLQSKRNKGF